MKCVYCDEVKPNAEVFTDFDPIIMGQRSYAVCHDCLCWYATAYAVANDFK